jgi:hypothetical protein
MFVPYFGWIVQGAAAIALTSVFGFGLSCPYVDSRVHRQSRLIPPLAEKKTQLRTANNFLPFKLCYGRAGSSPPFEAEPH